MPQGRGQSPERYNEPLPYVAKDLKIGSSLSSLEQNVSAYVAKDLRIQLEDWRVWSDFVEDIERAVEKGV